MSLPMAPNNTCDIYRTGHTPPATPDVAGVACYLMPYGQSSLTTPNYTHILYVAATVDIRDNFIASTVSTAATPTPCTSPTIPGRRFWWCWCAAMVRGRGPIISASCWRASADVADE